MKIISWNVNSVRARITNILEYIKQAKPDILLIQEIKTEDKNFPYEEFEKNGYYSYVYGFSDGFRKNNALLGRNQQQRNDVAFDVVTTTARVHSSSRFVSSGTIRTLDPEGLNQLVGFFIWHF